MKNPYFDHCCRTKSPNVFITKLYSCKKSLSTGKVDKETMKFKMLKAKTSLQFFTGHI